MPTLYFSESVSLEEEQGILLKGIRSSRFQTEDFTQTAFFTAGSLGTELALLR